MKFHFLFLVLILSTVGSNANNSSSSSSRLIDILQDLCPGANICRENQTTQTPLKTFQSGYESCCTACSCAPDCEGDGNCCFPRSEPQQQSDGTASLTKTVCLFPATFKPSVNDRFQSYYMITSVSENSVDDIKPTTNASCGDENVAPWGSLYPVYSAKRKQIYKNMACASNDGVQDGTLWDAELICSADVLLDVSSFVLGLNSDFIHDNCQVNFIFQGDSEDIRPLTCYVDPVNICEASEFQMPDGIDASKEEIIEACTSGLVSPHTDTKLYANVFCHICNAAMFRKERSCNTGARNPTMHGFTGLIDGSFIAESRLGYLEGAPKYPRACSSQVVKNLQDPDCRTVFCPSGQLRDRAGKCRYLNKLWYNQQYSIFINLTAEEYINIDKIFQVNPGKISNTLPNFDSPWQNNWYVDSLLFEDFGGNKNITKFLVILTNKKSEVQPNQLVTNIKKMIIRKWLLRLNNSRIVLKSSIIKGREIILYIDKKSEILIRNHSVSIHKPHYNVTYRSGIRSIKKQHLITKLYLCNQVELTQSDFILSHDETILFNTITTQVLYDGEFTIIRSHSFKDVRARVCIEDSGLYSSDQVSFSYGSSLFRSYSVLLLVFALLFLMGVYLHFL